jgi:hypothetical protein
MFHEKEMIEIDGSQACKDYNKDMRIGNQEMIKHGNLPLISY